MKARAGHLGFGDPLLDAFPLDESGSDSAILDNALEAVVRGGRDVRHAITMLVPESWELNPVMPEEIRDFYRYHAGLVEPWDGPAGIVFTDGRVVGAALDRNGLRPLRYAIVEGGLVACASEAGVVPLPDGGPVTRGKLGPNQMLTVDPDRGVVASPGIKLELARRRPYGQWLAEGIRRVEPGEPVAPPEEDLTVRQVTVGYTREEISLMLRPIGTSGHDPVSSMGDDTALPPLAGRARPLASYFRQGFAQVTNPAIDHLRERLVMSLRTLLGARAPLLSEGPEAARLTELESFFLYPSALAELDATALDATFDAGEGLRAACERLGRRGRRGRRGRGRAAAPERRAPRGRPRADPVAARRRRRPPAPRRRGPAHARLAARRERRAARDAPLRHAARLRRRRDLPAARARDDGRARRRGQDRRRPPVARRGAAPLPRGHGGRDPQGHVQDGHLGRGQLPRRADLRRDRARAGGRRPRLHGHAVAARRHRLRRAGGRGARARGGRRRGAPEAREPRLREVPQGRRAARDHAGRRRRDPRGPARRTTCARP